ncbi:MAG: hypothetical protein H6709_06465 [Kofleriaceae bacterium]|nr:hypothetical protein [Myxococcales bacterium]MCB9560354.1 hypothetical protein [Kofleriaceae bacterium]MCB9571718.1 hypothetical protein [Kofleriaceae bacterium]
MKLSTTLFTASFVSVVVAGWNHLDAVAPVDGPADAPARHEVSIDGHAVRIELDHERIPAGQAIHATIAMVDPGPGGMDVKVQLLEQTGSMASRMPSPPREVSSQRVHLGADATTVPITLAGVARGDDADPLDFAGSATQYTLVVTAAGDGAAATGNGNGNGLQRFAVDGGAYLPVFAYEPEAYRLTIDAPAPGKVGDPVDVTIHVESLATRPITELTIGMGASFLEAADSPVIAKLAPGATTDVHVRATRVDPQDGPMLIQAYGWATKGGSAAAWLTVDRDTGAVVRRASEPYMQLALAGL